MPPHLRYYEFESDPDLTLTIPEAENLIGEKSQAERKKIPKTEDSLAERDGFELSVPLVSARKGPISATFLSPSGKRWRSVKIGGPEGLCAHAPP
jgi:hypothetical protein